MFFRKPAPEDDGDKGKPPKSAGNRKPANRKPANRKPAKKSSAPQTSKGSRRLDSTLPQIRPAAPYGGAPRRAERGAPLSDETLWLLDQMGRLRDINDYHLLKRPFIDRYLANPNHYRGSAERAFYHAVVYACAGWPRGNA